MAKWGSCDFQQLKNLQKNLRRLSDADMTRFCEDCRSAAGLGNTEDASR